MAEKRVNCWEYKNCGRGPGGEKAAELGVCPAATSVAIDGLHGGDNGGRACWAVAGTLCGGETQGTYAQKLGSCQDCLFYALVVKEQGRGLVPAMDVVERLEDFEEERNAQSAGALGAAAVDSVPPSCCEDACAANGSRRT